MKLIFAFVLCIWSAGRTLGSESGTDLATELKNNALQASVENVINKLKSRYGITPKILFSARNERGIRLRSRLPLLSQWMESKIEEDYNINIGVAFELLGKIGQLLRISYAGCKGFPCQVQVADVMGKYHDMIYDSLSVSNLFLRTTLRAVRYHKYAIRYLNRDSYDEEEKVERALKWVKKCGSLADKLVEASEKMVEKSDYLREMTHKAYVTTNKDEVKNRGDIKKAEAEYSALNASVSSIQAMQKSLEGRTTEMKEKFKEIERLIQQQEAQYKQLENTAVKTNKKCKTDKVRGFSLGNIGPLPGFQLPDKIVKTCYDELDQGAVDLRKTQLANIVNKINQLRQSKLQVLEMKNSIDNNMTAMCGGLAKSMTMMKSSITLKDDLKRAENALHVSYNALYLVRMIFANNKHYWTQVTENAKNQGSAGDSQTTMQEHEEFADVEGMEEETHRSGFQWLALGKVSSDARTAMTKAKVTVDNAFKRLPSNAQAENVIKNEASEILEKVRKMISALNNMTKITQARIESAVEEIAEEDGDKDKANVEETGEEGGEEEGGEVDPVAALTGGDQIAEENALVADEQEEREEDVIRAVVEDEIAEDELIEADTALLVK